jgi:hypothetical protein
MSTSIPVFVQHVTAQLGNGENPMGSNNTQYGQEFGWNGVSWCAEFGWDMYHDCGVDLPMKSAACVAIWDDAAKRGLTYTSNHCVPGDSIIRTWQHLPRQSLDPAQTHYQIVVGTHIGNDGGLYLDLIGGNQGPGVVSRDAVKAGDASVLGGLAFHTLFTKPAAPVSHDNSGQHLPAPKSHKYPKAYVSLGSHGWLVQQVQKHLQAHGFYKGFLVDGIFGRNTLAAVLAFQKHAWPHDPHQWDGVVGPNTYRALGF